MSGTSLLMHMLGYTDAETLSERFRDAVKYYSYDADDVNEMIRELNDTYDTKIPEAAPCCDASRLPTARSPADITSAAVACWSAGTIRMPSAGSARRA